MPSKSKRYKRFFFETLGFVQTYVNAITPHGVNFSITFSKLNVSKVSLSESAVQEIWYSYSIFNDKVQLKYGAGKNVYIYQ